MSAFLGELVGTMILIILGCGVCASGSLTLSMGKGTGWLMGAVGWGLAVTMGVFAVGEVSGAHLNPAVTLGFATIGEFDWALVPIYISGQFLGAFLGAIIVFFHYAPHWSRTDDPGTKLGVFATGPAIAHTPSNILSEVIGTFLLVLGLLAIGTNEFTQGLKPVVVGLLITSIGLSLGSTTGYAINPARDLAPRLAHALLPIVGKGSSNWHYAWIPVIGPIIGGCFGGLFYQAVFKQITSTWFWVSCAVTTGLMGWTLATRRSVMASADNDSASAA